MSRTEWVVAKTEAVRWRSAWTRKPAGRPSLPAPLGEVLLPAGLQLVAQAQSYREVKQKRGKRQQRK